jgi:GNAT superfamily N-acetyltransferase
MIQFLKAKASDAEVLAKVCERAFHSDVDCGAPAATGGPPGYDSAAFQRKALTWSDYYKIVVDDKIVGGVFYHRTAPREFELDRIFVDPDYQNQGIGAKAMEFVLECEPLAKRWTLGTPEWNLRTRHFYPKFGFVEIGRDRFGGILFERRSAARKGKA